MVSCILPILLNIGRAVGSSETILVCGAYIEEKHLRFSEQISCYTRLGCSLSWPSPGQSSAAL